MKKVEIQITDHDGNIRLHEVIGNSFTNDELKLIKTDILYVFNHNGNLNVLEVHERNLILNKIKEILGEDYHQ